MSRLHFLASWPQKSRFFDFSIFHLRRYFGFLGPKSGVTFCRTHYTQIPFKLGVLGLWGHRLQILSTFGWVVKKIFQFLGRFFGPFWPLKSYFPRSNQFFFEKIFRTHTQHKTNTQNNTGINLINKIAAGFSSLKSENGKKTAIQG